MRAGEAGMDKDFEEGMPERIRALPRDRRGYPVPFFVEWFDGVPDFRVMNPRSLQAAVQKRLCWICGKPMMRWCAFVGGPLVVGQRISAEPPSHTDCADFAARVCPFLAIPTAMRREAKIPSHGELAGVQVRENPGVAAVIVTRSFTPTATPTGPMFRIGEPTEVRWFLKGRLASRADLSEVIEVAMARFASLAPPGARTESHAREIRARIEAALPPA